MNFWMAAFFVNFAHILTQFEKVSSSAVRLVVVKKYFCTVKAFLLSNPDFGNDG